MNKISKNYGFTLFELLAVLAIIAIIAAIAFPAYKSLNDTAGPIVENYNMTIINKDLKEFIFFRNFDDEHIYTYIANRNGDDMVEYLSRYIEYNYEVAGDPSTDEDNSNILGIFNPLSKKVGVVNWGNPPQLENYDDFYGKQSMYITSHSSASYDPSNLKDDMDACYWGALIMYYDRSSGLSDHIFFYYVDYKGMQSKEYFVYTRE